MYRKDEKSWEARLEEEKEVRAATEAAVRQAAEQAERAANARAAADAPDLVALATESLGVRPPHADAGVPVAGRPVEPERAAEVQTATAASKPMALNATLLGAPVVHHTAGIASAPNVAASSVPTPSHSDAEAATSGMAASTVSGSLPSAEPADKGPQVMAPADRQKLVRPEAHAKPDTNSEETCASAVSPKDANRGSLQGQPEGTPAPAPERRDDQCKAPAAFIASLSPEQAE